MEQVFEQGSDVVEAGDYSVRDTHTFAKVQEILQRILEFQGWKFGESPVLKEAPTPPRLLCCSQQDNRRPRGHKFLQRESGFLGALLDTGYPGIKLAGSEAERSPHCATPIWKDYLEASLGI